MRSLYSAKQREKEISGDVGRSESRRSRDDTGGSSVRSCGESSRSCNNAGGSLERACDDTGSSSVRSCNESRRSCDCVSGGSVLVCGESMVTGYILWARK